MRKYILLIIMALMYCVNINAQSYSRSGDTFTATAKTKDMKKFFVITKGISLWAAVMVSLIAACNFPTCVNNGDKGGIFASVICVLIGIFWASCFSEQEWEKYSGYSWIKKNIFHDKD